MTPKQTLFAIAAVGTIWVAILAAVGVYYIHNMHPAPPGPAVADPATLGQQAARKLALIEADGWERAAAAIEGSAKAGNAAKAKTDAVSAAKGSLYDTDLGPEFARVLPPGTEPIDRAAVGKFWRDFAAGLRKGAK